MAWKCPECGTSLDDAKLECDCGYSFFKVLGVKPGASPADVEKAYRYLRKVWQSGGAAQEPVAQKRARARMQKIEEAYLAYKSRTRVSDEPSRTGLLIKVASIAAVCVLCVIVLFFYFRSPGEESQSVPEETHRPAPVKQRGAVTPTPPPAAVTSPENPTEIPAPAETEEALPEVQDEGERAVEMVKKSHVLDPVFPVEAVLKKWSETTAGKMQVIGWQAKKMADQVYVVSYTASDGLNTRGFYFEVNLESGTVRNVANSPELQQKYGIKYK